YGEKTLRVLAQYSKMISVLLKSYTEKYDLLNDAKVLGAISSLEQLARKGTGGKEIAEQLIKFTSQLVEADDSTVVLFDEKNEKWKVVAQKRSAKNIAVGQVIDYAKSIVGEVIRSQNERLIDNIADEKNAVRFFSGENLTSDGSFLCIPILSHKKCFGAIAFEKEGTSGFTNADAAVLQPLVSFVGTLFDVSSLKQFINECVSVDSATSVLTEHFFHTALENELDRAHHYNGNPALALIGIDDEKILQERFGESGIHSVRRIVAQQIQSCVRTFDSVGQLEQFFIALLIDTNVDEIQLWGEKMRTAIASTVLNDNGKQFSVTVSIGISAPTKLADSQTMISNVRAAMNKAVESGGNTIKIF
ncbi:MAG: sensor domain-containing diguanylate cyclase, partial [Bacteroidota bacterium]